MLKDRKVLVEEEIVRQTEAAAAMYLDKVRGVAIPDSEYEATRDRIAKLQHDRKLIQLLLDQGHD